MPSIIGTSYPVSVMVPSVMPAPLSAPDNRQAVQKQAGVSPAESSRVLSDRVTAFLSTDQAAMTKGPRPDGPAAGGQGPRGAAPRDGSGHTDAETALTLLAEAEDDTDESDASASETATGAGTVSILLDEAKIYRPSSLY
jgi:hypothetical protein